MSSQNDYPEDLGVLLFAFSNEAIDYLDLALECARRIKRFWNVPVSVVIDKDNPFQNHHSEFDLMIRMDRKDLKPNMKVFHDYERNLSFWNSNRVQALELTPYRRTILLDVDVLIQTDDIPRLWDGQGLKLCKSAYSVFDYHPLSMDMQVLSEQSGLPMYWATCICFDKESDTTKRFFSEWKKVLTSYRGYSFMYGFPDKPVRNDFAVTLAAYKLLEHRYNDESLELPYSIPSLMPMSELTSMQDDCLLVRNHEGGTTAVYSDLHVMNKKSILTCMTQLTNKGS